MTKEYTYIEYLGDNLDAVVTRLQEYWEDDMYVITNFNGHSLKSDEVTLDTAYKAITGYTKAEFELMRKKELNNYLKEELLMTENSSTKHWVEEGHKILDKKYWSTWDECVPIRLNDLYHGMELGCCLEIIEELNNGCELSRALTIMERQNHSGMSWSLVRAMVKAFCDRGPEFSERAV